MEARVSIKHVARAQPMPGQMTSGRRLGGGVVLPVCAKERCRSAFTTSQLLNGPIEQPG